MLASLLVGISPSPGLFPVNANASHDTNTSMNGIVGADPSRPGVVLRREQVRVVLFEGKTGIADIDDSLGRGHGMYCPHKPHTISDRLFFCYPEDDTAMLGTLSLVTGRPMCMDTVLPDWLEKGVESSLRDTEESVSVPQGVVGLQRSIPVVLTPSREESPVESQGMSGGLGSGSGSKGAWRDLDQFYADTEEGGEEDESESESESGSEEGDEDDEGDEGDEGANEDEEGEEEDEEDENEEEVGDSAAGEEQEEDKGEDDSDKETHTQPAFSVPDMGPSFA